MTAIQFVPAGDCLLSHTVAAVEGLGDRDFRHVVTILPTGRLGHYLLAALAQSRGAIMPPTLHTVAGFFRTIDRLVPHEPMSSPQHLLPALAPAAATLWLKTLLGGQSQRRFRSLGPQHAGELMVFYKELIESGLWQDWFDALTQYVEEECYHHERHLDAVMARFVEVRTALTDWREQILSAGLTLQVDDEAARAQRVAEFIAAGGLQGKTVVVAGLTSMAASWLPVFTALAEHAEDCRFILPEPPKLIAAEQPMAPLLAAIQGDRDETAIELVSRPAKSRAAGDIVMVQAEDGSAEVDFVIRAITELLAEGLKPAQIAVLVPSESAYSGLLTARLSAAGATFAVNLAIAQPLSASVLGSWWLTLGTALAGGQSPLAVYHALRQPLTQRLIALIQGSDEPPASFGPSFWQTLYRLMTARQPLPAAIDFDQLTAQLTEQLTDRAPEDAAAWQRLADGYQQLLAASQGDDLLRQLKGWLTVTYEQAMAKTLRAKPLEQSAYTALRELLSSLSALPGMIAGRDALSRSELWAHVLESSQAMTIRVTGEPMADVQVLSLAEARWLPVQVAFVLGCNEGFFPRGLPSDELMTDTLKKRLGLKGWQGLEAMEDLSFSLLTARVPKVFLCRPLSFAGEETVPSRFVEKLTGERHHPLIKAAHCRSVPAGGRAAPPTTREPSVFGQVGAIPAGWRHTGDAPWLAKVSATAVDRFLSCPYRFALDSLTLNTVDSPFEDRAAIDQGTLLHSLFEQFHEGSAELELELAPLPKKLPAEKANDELRERFNRLVSAHLGEATTPDSVQLRTVAGPRYVEHLIGLSIVKSGELWLPSGQSERAFDGDEAGDSARIALAGAERQLRGQVDRLDMAAGGMVITDYKRDGVPKADANGRLPSAQLLLYAAGLASAGLADQEQMILGYWSILKGEWTAVAVGDGIKDAAKSRGLAKKGTPSIDSEWQLVEEHFAAKLQQVEAEGRYSADDAACGFCQYAGICRRGDPRVPAKEAAS